MATSTSTDSSRYSAPAMALHWLIAILIFGGFGLGLFMHDLPVSADKLRYYSWHKWAGVTVFLLTLVRAGWRMTHPAPPLTTGARWEHVVAHLTHFALYGLMLAIPLSGWLHSSAAGYQTVYLGLIPLPDLLARNAPLADTLAEVHEVLNYALLALLLAHVGAALQHHWLRRDDILRRMLPTAGIKAWATIVTLAAVLAFAGIAALLLSDDDEGEAHHHGQQAADAAAASSGEITAEFRQMNVPVQGRFTSFHAQTLVFDPAHLETAKADIVADTASFDLGDADYNEEVRKPEWFDSARFPQAHFVSAQVSALPDGRFQASGQLTIKDRTAPVTVVFTATPENGQTSYAGELSVSRAAYAIGDAEWNNVLEDAVIVRFKLLVPQN